MDAPMTREFSTAPSLDDIETIASTAFDALPEAFRALTTGIVFRVDDFPDSETEEDLTDLVRHVLIHEIGHHFGLSDDDMERIETETS